MSKIQRARKTFLSVSLALIITFALLIHVNFARAQALGDTFDMVTLISGQSATKTYSLGAPFGLQTIGIISVGNRVLESGLSADMTGPEAINGIWFIFLMATGGTYWSDYAIGGAPYGSGETAIIDVDPSLSIGLATLGVFLVSPASDEDPVKNIKLEIEGTQ